MRWFEGWRRNPKTGTRGRKLTPFGRQRFDLRRAQWYKKKLGARRVSIREVKPKAAPLAERVVLKARGQIGVSERPAGSNSGRRVRQYQAATKLEGTGWPWCVAFIVWCADQVGGTYANYYGAYCPHLLLQAKNTGTFTKVARRGHAVLLDFTGDGVPDHVEIVRRVHKHSIDTIGGNTSAGALGSQANGGGVYPRTRSKKNVVGYVKPTRRHRRAS